MFILIGASPRATYYNLWDSGRRQELHRVVQVAWYGDGRGEAAAAAAAAAAMAEAAVACRLGRGRGGSGDGCMVD